MRRKEFMWQLETLLADISEEEKQEALSYYRSYFEDAGEENEERILRELESPEKVAATIKADLKMEQGNEAGVYTEHGFEDGRFENRKQELSQRTVDAGSYQQETSEGYQQGTREGCQQGTSGGYQQGTGGGYQQGTGGGYQQATTGNYGKGRSREEDRVIKIVVIAIAAVLTSPIWGGILLSILGTVFGLAVAFVATAFSLYICGGVLFGVGIGQLAVGSVAVGFGMLGASMFVLGLAILITIFCVWICGKGVPWLCELIRKLWRRVFPGKEQA